MGPLFKEGKLVVFRAEGLLLSGGFRVEFLPNLRQLVGREGQNSALRVDL